MKKIHGIHDRFYWVTEYDEWGVHLLVKQPAYTVSGELDNSIKDLMAYYDLIIGDLHFGSPIDAVYEILTEVEINEYLTPEKEDELVKLFKK